MGVERADDGFLSRPHGLSSYSSLVVVPEKVEHSVNHKAVEFFGSGVAILCSLGRGTRVRDGNVTQMRRCAGR